MLQKSHRITIVKLTGNTKYSSGWWFQIFVIFTSIWGRFPFWRAYFSDGLVQPPTSHCFVQKTTGGVLRQISTSLAGGNSIFTPENLRFHDSIWLSHIFQMSGLVKNHPTKLYLPRTLVPTLKPPANTAFSQGFDGFCFQLSHHENPWIWFRWCFFYGFDGTHGIHHHEKPPFGSEDFFEIFVQPTLKQVSWES